MTSPGKPFPFGLRDLFWLVVVALILAAWGYDHGRQTAEIEKLGQPKPTPPVKTWSGFQLDVF